MKPTMALKPLVFALASIMAMAAQAGGNDEHHHRRHHNEGPTWQQQLQIDAGATAKVMDTQKSDGNVVNNQGTLNTGKADNSLNNSNGNMGANVAAGDGNQQDNAAALATADETFIFGSAVSASSATQINHNNYVDNDSTKNNATLNNAGNSGSGNIGINVTAGDFNQQKNNLAIAVSGGRVATAAASANQTSSALVVENNGVQKYKKDTLVGTFAASGTYKGTGSGTVEDPDHKGGHGGYDSKGKGNDDNKLTFKEQGTVELAGYWTQQVLTKDGWKDPVVNNASMTNSMNGFSGNGGANISAGVGNQQSNSLSIAAGCKACM